MPWPVLRVYVEAAEQALGVRFPASFIAKMLSQNGGEVVFKDDDWTIHPFWDKSDQKRLARTSNDIVRETKKMRELDWFPRDAVAIAENADGDRLVLRPDSADPSELGPVVFLWEFHGGELQAVCDNPLELWEG